MPRTRRAGRKYQLRHLLRDFREPAASGKYLFGVPFLPEVVSDVVITAAPEQPEIHAVSSMPMEWRLMPITLPATWILIKIPRDSAELDQTANESVPWVKLSDF